MTHSGPTVPEAASSRSSVKDTLFLSKAESEWMEGGRGGVEALGAEPWPQPTEPEPGRDRVSVERVGELGQRKIPGLRLTGWTPSIQQENRWRVHREKKKEMKSENKKGEEWSEAQKLKLGRGREGCNGENMITSLHCLFVSSRSFCSSNHLQPVCGCETSSYSYCGKGG